MCLRELASHRHLLTLEQINWLLVKMLHDTVIRMRKVHTYGIVGGGVMAGVLFSLIRRADPKSRIVVRVRDAKKVAAWKRRGAIVMLNDEVFPPVDIMLLAVKPKDFSTVEITVSMSTLVISVMAGVSVATMRKKLRVRKIVRMMTNIAAEHGAGLAVWHGPSIDAAGRRLVRAICQAAGQAREVMREADIDRATVILGSGPAFLLRTLNDLTEAACRIGLSTQNAAQMAHSAFAAAEMLSTKESNTKRLIERIASKGGTTEAGLMVFKKAKTSAVWDAAVRIAYARTEALRKNAQ